jgi:drug/metabolite transporter (DMT)-like permease
MNTEEWLLLILLSLLWGSSFFLIKIVFEELQPLTVVLGRVGLAAIVLIAVI